MPIDGPSQIWDVDLLKQHVGELNNEVAGLKKEIQQIQKELETSKTTGNNVLGRVSELRRLVQDGHLRERHLRLRYLDLVETTDHDNATGVPQGEQPQMQAAVPGQTGCQDTGERVDPSIIERIPDNEEPSDHWPTLESVLPALRVHPGWGNYESMGKEGVVMGISLLGLDVTGRESVIELVVQQQLRHRELFPVFITDDDDFRALRYEHFVFEYLPPWPGKDFEPSRTRWEEFLVGRLALIKRKWGIRRFVSFAGLEELASIGQMDLGKHLSGSVEKDTE